jgi:hypothetical protein
MPRDINPVKPEIIQSIAKTSDQRIVESFIGHTFRCDPGNTRAFNAIVKAFEPPSD